MRLRDAIADIDQVVNGDTRSCERNDDRSGWKETVASQP